MQLLYTAKLFYLMR